MTEIIGIKTKFLFYAGIPLVSRQAEDSVCYFGLRSMESPTTRGAGGLDFSAIGGEKQRHGSAVIGAGGTGCKAPGLKTPNKTCRYGATSKARAFDAASRAAA